MRFIIIVLLWLLSPLGLFAAENTINVIKPLNNRQMRQFGDIFLGATISGGITNFMNHTTYNSPDTNIQEKGVYFYNLSFKSEFYFSSYAALNIDLGFHSLRFDRKSTWINGDSVDIQEKFYEQWFNRFTIAGKFLFWNMFYIQTGPSFLINYNSSILKDFIGLEPTVRIEAGVTLQWQLGLGISKVVGFQDNGDPFLVIDAGFFTYIPVVGSIIDNIATNSGGSDLSIKANPYQFEIALSFSFLI